MIRYYARLRSSLFPYIYSMAHKAARTALPIARALSLMYPDVPEYDYVANTYMLGDSLLVAVFDMNVTLPEGKWIDYWTGETYEGGRKIEYKIPEGRGGALFVRAGSVIAMMEPQEYVEKVIPENYILSVYPGADCEFVLVEDDGYTFDYMNGGTADTVISLKDSCEGAFTLDVGMRTGSFAGRAKREDGRYKESDPAIPAMGEVASFTVRLENCAAKSITLDGSAVDFTVSDGTSVFEIPAELHKNNGLSYKIKY